MKYFRSLTALLLALLLVLIPAAGVFAEDETAEWDQLPLGSSGYAIKAPAGYTDQGVTADEFAEGAACSYTNPITGVDIDVAEYAAAEEGFRAFSEALCAANEGAEYSYDESFNGLCVAGYTTEWVKDGQTLLNATVLFDAGDIYVRISFNWPSDQEDALDLVRTMIGTIGKAETEHIRLGSSPYFVTVPKGFYTGEISSEEAARGLIAYYLNDNLLFDFDVYENIVDESLTLADVAMQLCAVNGGSDLKENSFNGIPVYTFNGHDEYDGIEYDTLTAVLDSSNGSIVAVVCWIDDEPMRTAALGMLSTIATEDELIPNQPMVLRIGSSDYCIALPTTFVQGAVAEEDFEEEGYAACYYSPYGLFDIDLYQCAIADELPTLEEFTEKDCADYNGTELALDDTINGVHVTSYRSDEIINGVDYKCLTYTFADETYYYQLCFYWNDEGVEADIEDVMETLAPIEKTVLQLGSSAYAVTVPAGMVGTVYEYEDEPELMCTGYELSPLSFTVYEMTAEEQQFSLQEYATLEAEYYKGTDLTFTEINGIPAAYYYYVRTDALYNQYAVLTLCLKSGDTGYIDVDFRVNDYVAAFQAFDVINSLTLAQ